MYSNVFSSEIRQQNRTEQNRTEQNRTEQNRTEQNPYRASLPKARKAGRRTERVSLSKSSKACCRTEQLQNLFQLWNGIITRLILLQNKILQSLFQSFNMAIIGYTKQNIIFNYFKIFYAIF
ncbi:hypothetical protein EPJ77_09910 [Brachyspira aalborgi]|uniref:Uncharacterized protein n=1 Tax=Brachyspira aalborgi TaxID=29522 RepID=A0AB38PVX4_9SPIR|nr:hypothetical protein EPJ77_09910 [Brachyspira aalborgi]TXJ23875.1 hypothetical protein EPJ73_08380 [Brachyspira aalborgi]